MLAGAHPPACRRRRRREPPGKGAGNRVSRGRGPERHGQEGARRAAGQLLASPPRESRLESAGAGQAHGEAGPRPLSYRHQVRGRGAQQRWLAREGRRATGGAGGGEGAFPGGGGDRRGGRGLAVPGDARERKFRDPPCSSAHLRFLPQAAPCPQSQDPPTGLGNVTFTLGGLALQAPAFFQPWVGGPWGL